MKTTTNYGFKQPEGTDIVNIDDISDNFGSVDTEIKKANDKVVAHEGKGGSVHADVTTTASGFMSASDKTKLNGIATGAQTNQNAVQSIQVVTPTGTVVGTATAANTTDTIQLKEGNNIDIAVSGKVVTVNNTYSYTHPSGDGNLHVPATGTSNSGKVLKAGATAGSLAWGALTPTDVGSLPTSHEGQGGSVHADVTTSASGFMSAGDKTKLNGIAAGAQTNQNAVQSIQAVTSAGTSIGTAAAATATDTIQLKEGSNIDIAVSGKTLTLNNTYSYTHPTGDGNLHVPATGTSNSGKVLKAGSTAGSLAWGTLTSADVGLSNVTNDSQIKRSEMGVANGVSTLDANGVNKQPPISHASAGTSYGVADTSNYGHVKVGDGIAVSNGTISADIGTGLILEGTSPNKKIALANSGITAGTYEKVIVDAKGRVTSGGDLTASDIPGIPWGKITSGKPTTLGGYGITDGQQYPLTNPNGTAKTYSGVTDFNNMKIPGQYEISGSSYTNNPDYWGGGVETGALEVVAASNYVYQHYTDYGGVKLFRVFDGTTWTVWIEELNYNSVLQRYLLTTDKGYPLYAITSFNEAINTGIYDISSNTSLTGAPYTGVIYGILRVQRRLQPGDSSSLVQTFIDTQNGTSWIRTIHNNSWTFWRKMVGTDDFTGILNGNGFQKLPSGLIIQWGTITNVQNSVPNVITFPVAFPNAGFSFIATQYGGGGTYTNFKTDVASKTGTNLWINSIATGMVFNWIAIGW